MEDALDDLPATFYGYICEIDAKQSYLTLGRHGHYAEMEMSVPTRRIPPRWRHEGQLLFVCFNRRGKCDIKFMHRTYGRKEIKEADKEAARLVAALPAFQ